MESMSLFDGGHSEYTKANLDETNLLADPLALLAEWLEIAKQANVIEPTAMNLATSSENGLPSSRMVLLRGLDQGLIFYTNYLSRKGNELSENPNAAICFWWPVLERQIRIEGTIERVSAAESEAYFSSRPIESQAASASSPQSQIIPDRDGMERQMHKLLEQGSIERPEHWGGFRLIPTYFEFWQGRKARLHDRFAYIKQGEAWNIHRLAP
jgi:pyridoxamine 5'-phosphate oxidase